MASDDTFEVGYGKPPVETRFQKGKSGNPKGRPKGSVNFATALQRAFKETVYIMENGKRKRISKLEATMKQLSNMCASGNLEALKVAAFLTKTLDADSPQLPKCASNILIDGRMSTPEENDARIKELLRGTGYVLLEGEAEPPPESNLS